MLNSLSSFFCNIHHSFSTDIFEVLLRAGKLSPLLVFFFYYYYLEVFVIDLIGLPFHRGRLLSLLHFFLLHGLLVCRGSWGSGSFLLGLLVRSGDGGGSNNRGCLALGGGLVGLKGGEDKKRRLYGRVYFWLSY